MMMAKWILAALRSVGSGVGCGCARTGCTPVRTLAGQTGRWGAALVCVAMGPASCDMTENAAPRPESARANASTLTIKMDVPQMMRGTIASETIVLGYQDVVVRGYGLVVGLNGTGSRTLNSQIRAHMLAYMRRMGVGSPTDAGGGLSPEAMLSSPDTAVVIVEAVIPAGSVKGTTFDVRVIAEPSSGTTSLEGGRLYTTELRPGPLMTGKQTGLLAFARGDVFANPFAEPGAIGRDTVNRTIGRVMNGGVSTKDLPIKLRLATPSHARAETIQMAVNSLFPREPGQKDQTARGESDLALKITVPPSWHQRTREFIQVLQHSTIRLDAVEQTAINIKRTLQANPGDGEDAAWRWQALGKRAIPIFQTLYDYPEENPRLSALQAGAKLDDALAAQPLLDMAADSSSQHRVAAIALLADMQVNPRIDKGLRALLDDGEVDVRLAVFDALLKRGDPVLRRIGVDGKFEVVTAPSKKPMVYVAQSGLPRIAVFGEELAVKKPVFVSAWSDRFLIKDHDHPEKIEVYFREQEASRGDIALVNAKVVDFIQFLGHKTTIEEPKPGLGFTYAETVSALHQVWLQKYLEADFKAEQDRVLAEIRKALQGSDTPERPEFEDPDFDFLKTDEGDVPMSPIDPETGEPVDGELPADKPSSEVRPADLSGLDWTPASGDTGNRKD